MSINQEIGRYQLYITYLGNRAEQVLLFMRDWLPDLQTLPAIRYKIESDIKRANPSLIGLSRKTAGAISSHLQELGAGASFYHIDDENKPRYDHNRFGVRLLDGGKNKRAVAHVLRSRFDISEQVAAHMINDLPKMLLERISIDEAVAFCEQLHEAGASCDLPESEPSVFLDTSASDIPRRTGSYTLVLHNPGPLKLQMERFIHALLPELDPQDVKSLLDEAPVELLTGVSLETVEIARIRLEQLSAMAVIQSDEERRRLGTSIHAQNPDFKSGEIQVILVSFDRLRRIALINTVRSLIPGITLREVVDLLERAPVLLIEGVDHSTAAAVERQLQEVGAQAAIRRVEA